jgi:hypothetical protein
MSHLNHIAIKNNTNSLFFQENEEVNDLGQSEGFERRERTISSEKVKLPYELLFS